MKISVLASGSKGNVTYIEHNNTKILIDLGMNKKYVENKLKELGINPNDINAILISHTHSDHIKGLKSFIKAYRTNLYITEKMMENLKDSIIDDNVFYLEEKNKIDDLTIDIIKTSHDINDSIGFIINDEIVYITDTGYLNEKYYPILENKKAYLFESNHDIEMLMKGKYPYHVRQRIWGSNGHLSNEDSSYYLSKLVGNNTKVITLCHLSEENNTEKKAKECLIETLNKNSKNIEKIIVAKQDEMTELIEV
ncbi:MAG: MBL fold metallo-hydrolase [Bacilli bacterium]